MSELYPGQEYVHKHNQNIKRAEENFMTEKGAAGQLSALRERIAKVLCDKRDELKFNATFGREFRPSANDLADAIMPLIAEALEAVPQSEQMDDWRPYTDAESAAAPKPALLDYADYAKRATELAEQFELMFTRLTPTPRETVRRKLYDLFVEIDRGIWGRVADKLTAPKPAPALDIIKELQTVLEASDLGGVETVRIYAKRRIDELRES